MYSSPSDEDGWNGTTASSGRMSVGRFTQFNMCLICQTTLDAESS